MATNLQNLSEYNTNHIANASDMRFGIVVSEWNFDITNQLCKGAEETLKKHGAKQENIHIIYVPGSFELPLGGQILLQNTNVDAVLLLGCVIQGDTKHFDYVCQGVTQGTMELNLKYNKPFIFGVLTTNTAEQAMDRAGGKHGNKGVEAAITAIKMISLKKCYKME